MSNSEKIMEDFLAFTATAKEFIGEFVYAPFGIESSDGLNAITLYALMGVAVGVLIRIARPAPRARYRQRIKEYDYGRNV